MSTPLNQLNGYSNLSDLAETASAEKQPPAELPAASAPDLSAIVLPTDKSSAKELEFIGALRALKINQAMPAPPKDKIETSLPDSDLYYRYSSKSLQYGQESTVRALEEIAEAWSAAHASQINIGVLSSKGGGELGGHDTHRNGVDVDIRPIRKDGENRPTNINDPSYDRKATRELVLLVKEKRPNAVILFNDPVLVKEGLTKPYKRHDNHLHIRFK